MTLVQDVAGHQIETYSLSDDLVDICTAAGRDNLIMMLPLVTGFFSRPKFD